MMSKEELAAMIDRFRRKAETNYYNYQETGIQRYQREYQKADDVASALQMALDASDDHSAMVGMRCAIAELGSRARALRSEFKTLETNYPEIDKFLKSAISEASIRGLIDKE